MQRAGGGGRDGVGAVAIGEEGDGRRASCIVGLVKLAGQSTKGNGKTN